MFTLEPQSVAGAILGLQKCGPEVAVNQTAVIYPSEVLVARSDHDSDTEYTTWPPSFRDYGHVADFEFWEWFQMFLKAVSNCQLQLTQRLVFDRLRKCNASTDIVFHISGNPNYSIIEDSERFSESDSPLCIFDVCTGRTYIRVRLSDLNFVSLSVYRLNSEGIGICMGEVSSDNIAVMEQIKCIIKFHYSESEEIGSRNHDLLEISNFEDEVESLNIENLNEDLHVSDNLSISEEIAVINKSVFEACGDYRINKHEIRDDKVETINKDNERCHESSSEGSLEFMKKCEEIFGPSSLSTRNIRQPQKTTDSGHAAGSSSDDFLNPIVGSVQVVRQRSQFDDGIDVGTNVKMDIAN